MGWLIKRRLARHQSRIQPLSPEKMESARTLLFAVFARYGDGIIAFNVIREFIGKNPGKAYVVVTSHQLLPYARELLGEGVKFLAVNKRRPLQLLKTVAKLRRIRPDLGFNPWGYGDDSEFFLTYAQDFVPFKARKCQKHDNLYRRAREYLGLEQPEGRLPQPQAVSPVRHILICPFSTDITKSLGAADVAVLLKQLREKYPGAEITMALSRGEKSLVRGLGQAALYIFTKNRRGSQGFLDLMRQTDLFVGVDAGPLHLADALGKPGIGIFGPTAPETVLDAQPSLRPVRTGELHGLFCFVKDCRDPKCLHALFQKPLEEHAYPPSREEDLKLELKVCPYVEFKGDKA